MAASESTSEILSSAWVDEMLDMIRTASRLSLDWYRSDRHRRDAVENKNVGTDQPAGSDFSFDPVTEADRLVERQLRDEIERRFPDHGIVGEEFGTRPGSSPYSWIIDPIDGTRAFIVGQPMWGTLVGLLDDGRPVGGWMHIPCLDESYVGAFGPSQTVAYHRMHKPSSDASGNGDGPLQVSTTTVLGEAILASTHPDMFDDENDRGGYGSLRSSVRMTRFGGDCLNYGLLASGLVDLVVENGLAAYDIAPLIPVIEAAGGVVTTLGGRPAAGGGFVVAAATPEVHVAAIRHLTGA